MRIELVGGLGVGKSTLSQALEKVGFNCVYENLSTNPFLADCFVDPVSFRFPSQMWFVLSKFHEIKKFEKPNMVNVLDQGVLNIKAYTNMLFRDEDPEALAVIGQCFEYLEGRLGRPDLYINLQCSPETQMKRIRGRNRDHEKRVTLEYVTALQREMTDLLEKARADGDAVLDIDTEAVYFPGNIAYAEELAQRVAKMFNMDLGASLSPRKPMDADLPLQYDAHTAIAAE